ncbi:hypothetical protein DBR32_02900 [Taibaiella sp. KBW10]|nr:hypothetical protein DBR32_02900 [Taibaiella sp. KBW10]
MFRIKHGPRYYIKSFLINKGLRKNKKGKFNPYWKWIWRKYMIFDCWFFRNFWLRFKYIEKSKGFKI